MLYVKTIHSIEGNEVLVAGTIENVYMCDMLCTLSKEKMILLNTYFPMMTVAKCKIMIGSIKHLNPGMKVYKYNSPKKEKEKEQEK